MAAYALNERPSIKQILAYPWMEKISVLNKEEEEYKKLEKQVFEKFKEWENKIYNGNKTVNTNNNFSEKIVIEENKGLSDNELEK